MYAAVVALGFTGLRGQMDVDALMIRNIGAPDESGLGDEILFSIRAAPGTGWHGGEIVRLRVNAPPAFLVHGGHTWDPAFNVGNALGASSDEVDAIEALAAPKPAPGLGSGAVVALVCLLAGLGIPAARARTR